MWKYFLDFIAPKKCYGCKKTGTYFCEDCVKKQELHFPYCYVCKKSSPGFRIHSICKQINPHFRDIESIIVWTHYRGLVIQKIIKDAKFYKKKDIFKDLPHLFKDNLEKYAFKKETTIVFPPMHFLRKWKRGYNHSEILAQSIADILDISLKKDLLQKTRQSKQQSKLSKMDRLRNLKGAFKVKEKYRGALNNMSIILVDDVVSSGATLCEMSHILKAAGVKKIQAIVIASD